MWSRVQYIQKDYFYFRTGREWRSLIKSCFDFQSRLTTKLTCIDFSFRNSTELPWEQTTRFCVQIYKFGILYTMHHLACITRVRTRATFYWEKTTGSENWGKLHVKKGGSAHAIFSSFYTSSSNSIKFGIISKWNRHSKSIADIFKCVTLANFEKIGDFSQNTQRATTFVTFNQARQNCRWGEDFIAWKIWYPFSTRVFCSFGGIHITWVLTEIWPRPYFGLF